MALLANQFSTEISNTTSTGIMLGGLVPFTAGLWRVENDGTVPCRLTLASTSPSTDGYEVKAGESRDFALPGATNRFALSTTSSSTEDHRRVRVLAMGN